MTESIRDRITDTWLEMVKKRDPDKIKVSDLTEVCNISRATFYYYFTDVFSIVEYLSQKMYQDSLASIPDTLNMEQSLYTFLRSYFLTVSMHDQLVSSRYRERYAEASINCIRSVLRELVRRESTVLRVTTDEYNLLIDLFANGIAGVLFHEKLITDSELKVLSDSVCTCLLGKLRGTS